jgi:hypothetical protein
MRVAMIAAMSLLCAAPRAAHAQRFYSLGVTDKAGAQFIVTLQKAVAANDRAAVVHMINYPVRVNQAHKTHRLITSPELLLREYDAVFTPFVRHAITSDKVADMYISNSGVAIDRGVVWLTGVCTKERPPVCHLGVSSVNLP